MQTVAYLAPYRGRVGHRLHTDVLKDRSVAYRTGATGPQTRQGDGWRSFGAPGEKGVGREILGVFSAGP